MRLLFVAALFCTSYSFTVLPYIQIDFAHFFRLAQCQSKCTEKYGSVAKKMLNDGSIEEYFNVTDPLVEHCELGCQQHRRGKKIQRSVKSAVQDGVKFWQESHADTAKVGNSPIAAVKLLCQMNSAAERDFEDSVEGVIGVSMKRAAGPVRYIVQWKQRTFALGFYDESQWITASIEPSTLFRVEGLIPGVQYRFMITVVGPNGRLGNAVTSDWVVASGASLAPRVPAGPINVKNAFNTEYGVSAHLSWERTAQDSCTYRMVISNLTHLTTRDFHVDTSEGILLKNLEFESQYTVQVSAIGSRSGEPNHPRLSAPVSTQFTSFACNEVYGKGSINCAPLPVEAFTVNLHSNGTALLSWIPSAEVENILTYQVQYVPVEQTALCRQDPINIYFNANTRSAAIQLEGARNCEYLIRLINYDSLGREAFTESRVVLTSSAKAILFEWQAVLIAMALFVIFLLLLVIRCSMSSKCKENHKVAEKEKKKKLVEFA